jgi:hypothetical protein
VTVGARGVLETLAVAAVYHPAARLGLSVTGASRDGTLASAALRPAAATVLNGVAGVALSVGLRFPQCGGRPATRRLARARVVGRQFGRWHEFHVPRAPTAPDAGEMGGAPSA